MLCRVVQGGRGGKTYLPMVPMVVLDWIVAGPKRQSVSTAPCPIPEYEMVPVVAQTIRELLLALM